MSSNKGITLVALVITIIVLLILAGVSISLVVGDNGIMTRAKDAGEKTNDADAVQTFQLVVASLTADYYSDKYGGSPTVTEDNVLAYISGKISGELGKMGYALGTDQTFSGDLPRAEESKTRTIKIKKSDGTKEIGISFDVGENGDITNIKKATS